MPVRPTGRRGGVKSWFVEPYRQVKLGLIFLLVNLVFSVLIFGIFGYYVWEMYQAVSAYFQLSDPQSAVMATKFTAPIIAGALLIALFVLSTIMLSVRYTHQIYGPLVSIHRFLDDLLNGNKPDNLQLRESDQLKELAERLNSLAERYNADQRHSSMVPIYRYLDEILAGKSPSALQLRDSDQMSELAVKLNKLAEMLKRK